MCDDLKSVVDASWSLPVLSGPWELVVMRKLKRLKLDIKKWRESVVLKNDKEKSRLENNIIRLELKAESGPLSDSERLERIDAKKRIMELNSVKRIDLIQKARVKWDVDGDENSKFFHGLVNSNIARTRINGLSIDGQWVNEPTRIKEEVVNFFDLKFKELDMRRPTVVDLEVGTLDEEDKVWLEGPFTPEEIKGAIWACGNDKAPGPDGFTFKFLKYFWDTVKHDFISFVKDFEVNGLLPDGCNSSFISLIPKVSDPSTLKDYRPINLIGCLSKVVSKLLALRLKKVVGKLIGMEQSAYIEGRNILDGHLVINETIAWAKSIKKKCMLFKVDFDKAFDSVNWNYLDTVMGFMGFGVKWRSWVSSILISGKASILVNGSPTKEFKFQRGVKQGDPLSPYLFLIAIEGLNAMIKKAIKINVFKGISLPNQGPIVSHVLYADDAIFIGDWEVGNVLNLARILRCFHLTSGLKVNFFKSKVFGVGVGEPEVKDMARFLRCEPGSLPFSFLGLPVATGMGRSVNWGPVLDRLKSRLNSWKASCLSFGGRLTLIKAVLGSLPLYFLSMFRAPNKVIEGMESIRRHFLWSGRDDYNKINWVAWRKVVMPKVFGGLGVGSLRLQNLALIAKWWWRWRLEPGALWVKCISAIHRVNNQSDILKANRTGIGPWAHFIKVGGDFMDLGVDLNELIVRSVGAGDQTRFWKDAWFGRTPLCFLFPNLYELEKDKNCLIRDRVSWDESGLMRLSWNWRKKKVRTEDEMDIADLGALITSFQFSSDGDKWSWAGGKEEFFSVKAVRNILENNLFGSNINVCNWLKWVPIKVNCFVWRAFQNRIPVAANLMVRGVRLVSGDCAHCPNVPETTDHVFIDCETAKQVWRKVSVWAKWDFTGLMSVGQLRLQAENAETSLTHKLFLGIIYTGMWCLWKARNDRIFKGVTRSADFIMEEIVSTLFNWVKHRAKRMTCCWERWITDPCNSFC
ncbi:putative RNA-directed DNA polymerase [Helianthus debilis subsp. tardiflorus]